MVKQFNLYEDRPLSNKKKVEDPLVIEENLTFFLNYTIELIEITNLVDDFHKIDSKFNKIFLNSWVPYLESMLMYLVHRVVNVNYFCK